MEPWKDLIGDDLGVFCMFDEVQIDGSIYTAAYQTFLAQIAEEAYPSVVTEVADNQGIFANTAAAKFNLMSKVKANVLRVDTAEYIFNKQFYYNPDISQGEVLGLLKTGDISTFLVDTATIKLTVLNGSDFLDMLL